MWIPSQRPPLLYPHQAMACRPVMLKLITTHLVPKDPDGLQQLDAAKLFESRRTHHLML